MVPPYPTPNLVMIQAGLSLGRFHRRFDPEPMGPHPSQLAQSDLGWRVTQGIVDSGIRLDGPHHDQTLFRTDPPFMLGLDPDTHRLDFQGSFRAMARHQADPAGCALPGGHSSARTKGASRFRPMLALRRGGRRRSRSRTWVLHGTSRMYHSPPARRFARNSADRPSSSSPT